MNQLLYRRRQQNPATDTYAVNCRPHIMIKRFTSLLLILLLSCQCLLQLGMIGYFQLNREYIAAFLCINREEPQLQCEGQCFLKDQLSKTSDEQQSDVPSTQNQSLEIPLFLISETRIFLSFTPTAELPQVPRPTPIFFSSPLHSIFHPPRV